MSVRLRHVAAINPPTPEFELLPDTAELPFFPLEAVWPGDRLDTTRRQSRAAVSSGYTRFREGDILLPKITPTFQADRTVIANGLEGGVGAGTTELHVVRAGPDADVRYLRYLLSSKNFLDEGEASMIGVAGQKRVPDDCLRDLAVPVVDLRRQRAIADYLDREITRIDALIEKKRRMLTLLEEKFLEVVRNQVTGGISFDDSLDIRSKDVLNLRAGWAPVKLGQDFRFGSGTTPRAGDERYYGGQIPWIVTGDLSDDLLRTVTGSVTPEALAEFSALQVHPVGALIVAMYGATVGRLAVSAFPAAVNQACCVMHSGTRLRTWFVFYYLLSHRPVLMERAVGAGQPNISQEILRSLRIPAPDLEVQDRIVAMLDDVHTRVDQLVLTIRTQIGLLQEHRQALITAAVTGELEVSGVAA